MPRYYLYPGESQFKTIMIKQVYDECYAFKYGWNSSSIWHFTVVCDPTSLWSSVAKIGKNARLEDIKKCKTIPTLHQTAQQYMCCVTALRIWCTDIWEIEFFLNHTGYLKANFKPENSQVYADKIWYFLIDAIPKLILFFSDGTM